MVFILTACGSGDTTPTATPPSATESTPGPVSIPESTPDPTPEPTPEPTSEPVIVVYPVRGIVEDDVYKSKYLGIQLNIPDGWFVASMYEAPSYGGIIYNYLDELPESFWEQYTHFYDLLIGRSGISPSVNQISIDFREIPLELIEADNNEIDLINFFISTYEEGNIDIDQNQTPQKFGNFNWYVCLREEFFNDMYRYSIKYISASDGFFRKIDAHSFDPDEFMHDLPDLLSLITPYP